MDRTRVGFAGRGGRLASGEARMRAYLRVNLLAIWSSVLALAILRLVLGPSQTIVGTSSRSWRAASCC